MDSPRKEITEQDYKDIYDKSPVAKLIVSTDKPAYTILDVNEAYLRETNSKREDLIGRSVFSAFPENPSDLVSRNVERSAFSFGEAIRLKKAHVLENYRYDIPVPGTDKFEERYWTTVNTPVLDAAGEVRFIIHSPGDVTEIYRLAERERRSTEALKIQRKRLYATFMQAPIGISIMKGPDYILDMVNPLMAEMHGKTVAELKGKPVFEVLSFAKGKGYETIIDQVRTTGKPFKGEAMAVDLIRNGQLETAWFNVAYEPFREDNDEITGVICTAVEVTTHVKESHRIEEAEERARLATDAAGLGAFDVCLKTGRMITSLRFAHIMGFDHTVERAEYVEMIHKDDRHIYEEAHRLALETGKLFYELRINWKDHVMRWVRAEGKVYAHSDGTKQRILGVLLDITDQRALQQQKDDFIGIASHELKTPVTSIKAYAQILQKMLYKKGLETESGMMAKMDVQLDRLAALIGDLLDVTKMNSGKIEFSRQEFDFNDLVQGLAEDLQRTTTRHTIRGDYGNVGLVYGDKDRIGQVIINLISNAIKYAPHAEQILIRTCLREGEIMFRIKDFGIGIAEDHLKKVFEQFYRVSGVMNYNFPGLGLGLYISSEIIKREGGRIWVNSTEGEGAEFCFTIPVLRKYS